MEALNYKIKDIDGIEPTNNYVLVKYPKNIKKSSSGFLVVDSRSEEERNRQTVIAEVIKVGPMLINSEKEEFYYILKPGDKVLFNKVDMARIHIANDTENEYGIIHRANIRGKFKKDFKLEDYV